MDNLDETDKEILRILQADAKKTTKEIASMLNLTISPVYERIRKLESAGYISKYVAILDKTLINQPITTICQVSMRYHNEAFIENFEKEVQKLEEVQECYHMAGEVDFLLKINVASLSDYHNFVRYKLSKIENIGVLNSAFVLKEIKQTSAFNI